MIYAHTGTVIPVDVPPTTLIAVPAEELRFIREGMRTGRDMDVKEPISPSPGDVIGQREAAPPGVEDAVAQESAVTPTPDGAEELVERFESERRWSIAMGGPMLRVGFGPRDWLDGANPADLPAMADVVILGQAARLAVRAVARVEDIWRLRIQRRRDVYPLDDVTRDILQERDRAVAYYMEIRERQARIAHLEELGKPAADGGRRRRTPAAPRPTLTKG